MAEVVSSALGLVRCCQNGLNNFLNMNIIKIYDLN